VYLAHRRLPEAVTIVLHPRGKMKVTGAARHKSRQGWTSWNLKWHVVNLWALSAKELLGMNEVGLIPWVPLTKFDGPPGPLLEECRQRIEDQAPETIRANLLAVTHVLGRLRYDLPTLTAIFKEKREMIESPFFQDILVDPEIMAASPL